MKSIITLRQDGEHKNLHAVILSLIDEYGSDIESIYFMDRAVKVFAQTDSTLQQSYLTRAQKFNIRLICCGRALTEQGFEAQSVVEGAEVAGYTDLAVSLAQAQKVFSF